VDFQDVFEGECAVRPEDPTRAGFTFYNWYTSDNFNVIFDFAMPIFANTTVYARWTQNQTPVADDYNITGLGPHIYDRNAKPVSVTPKADKSTGEVTVYYEGTGGTSYTKSTTAPVAAGTYAVTFDVAAVPYWNAATGFPAGLLTINRKTITINGVSATNRPYNGTTTVTLTGGVLQDVEPGDTVGFTLGTGTISDASAGNNKPVTVNIQLTGADRDNYTLTQPELTVNVTVNQSFTITFEQIIDAAPAITGPVIHRSSANGLTTATITVDNPGQYSSIEWHVNGTNVRGTGASFTLNSANSAYNNIGDYFLTVEVMKGNVPYNHTVAFKVVE